jgi:hypothetical protein
MITELSHPHVLLGAYVLGGLRPDEVRSFTEHLPSCPACLRELEAVATLPALLGSLDGAAWLASGDRDPEGTSSRVVECAGPEVPGGPPPARAIPDPAGRPGGVDGNAAVTS